MKEVGELDKQLPENKEAIEAKWSEIAEIVKDVTERLTNVIELMEEVNDKHKCWCGGEFGLIQEASFSNGGYSNHLKCDKCGKHVIRYG